MKLARITPILHIFVAGFILVDAQIKGEKDSSPRPWRLKTPLNGQHLIITGVNVSIDTIWMEVFNALHL